MRQEARDDGVLECSGISWTTCKQSAPCSRQTTTSTPHHSIFTCRMLFLAHPNVSKRRRQKHTARATCAVLHWIKPDMTLLKNKIRRITASFYRTTWRLTPKQHCQNNNSNWNCWFINNRYVWNRLNRKCYRISRQINHNLYLAQWLRAHKIPGTVNQRWFYIRMQN